MQPRKFNYIYSHLVDGKNDIVGHIAYGLYKADKINWIEEFKRKHNGQAPTEEDLEPFHEFSSRESSKTGYINEANSIIATFIRITLNDTVEDARREILTTQQDILSKIIEPLKPPSKGKQFFTSLTNNVLSTIVVTVLTLLLFLLIFMAKIGTKETFEKALDIKIIPTDTTNTSK